MRYHRVAVIVMGTIFSTVGCSPNETSRPEKSSETSSPAASSNGRESESPALQEKRAEYRDVMRELVEVYRQRYMEGTDSIDQLIAAEVTLLNAELATSAAKTDRVAILKASLEKLKELEQYQQSRISIGAGRTDEMAKAKAARLRGEIRLIEEELRDD
ncbi:MAG: hypothetical protein AAGJ83_03240 [Planctomycetota bacterium]